MVSAISICVLALGLSAASSQLITSEAEYPDAPISERRTFKHGKPVKFLPLVKKHKKFSSLASHVLGKTTYTEVPVIHETSKPVYKFHRYQGIEVKPVNDIIFSTPGPIIETHSIEPPTGDFASNLNSDQHFLPPVPSSVLLYPVNDKPIFSPPSIPIYAPLPPPPPKPIYSFLPAPPQPVFSSLPITSIPPPAFSSISAPQPATPAIAPPAPIFTPIPASFPSNPPPPPPQPIFTSIPIKLQTPILPPLSAPPPAPVFSSIPVKIPAPVLPSPSPPPSNIFSSVSVKIPAPVLPSAPTPSPAPIFSSISTVSPTPGPTFSSTPVSLPPPQFSALPSPAPSFSAFPPPAPVFPSFSIPAIPEPEFPYPPSGTPIPSYIKDVSLGNIEIKDSPLPTLETPKYTEITPSTITDDGSKNLHLGLGAIKNENGFFQKIKDWKADKANAALSHFTHFKQKPAVQTSISIPRPPNKIPVEVSTQAPVYPTLQFPGPIHPLPLAPAPVFFPPHFFSPAKYENFPPNNIESPPLLNSYGAPISHDSYALSHVSHDRLSSAASEEEPAVVPPPSNEKKAQNTETEPRPIQTQEFQAQNFQTQFQQQGISHDHPVYVAETNPTVKEENKTIEDVQPDGDDYKTQKEPNSEEVVNYPNHKE